MPSAQQQPMDPDEFLHASKVTEILDDLRQHFIDKKQPLIVSDVTDAQGNQYVDLVQEGGGVLGIALVGYTYVLEKMGIRFFSMAGTSAGSINAMLLACTGNKEDQKSSVIVDHLIQLKMFSFVDGKPASGRFTRWIKGFIEGMLMGKNPLKKITNFVKRVLIILAVLTIGSFIFNFFAPGISKWIGLGAFITMLIIVWLVLTVVKRFKQFAKDGYGLNTGNEFHQWIKTIIETCYIENDPAKGPITNYTGFAQHFMRVPALEVKKDSRRMNNQAPNMPILTIITCDIIAKRKIEFPLMWDLYWKKTDDVHPADFVRASMSIPVFFETFSRTGIRDVSTFDLWNKHLNWENEKKNIPNISQFIDGGTLSNFPINVFYNPNYPVPRMPTFGIRLQDGILDGANSSNNSFIRYVTSLFSTIRFNFDRDFITKNRAYTLGVKNIDVSEYSWLNFFMKDEDKAKLFEKGARAAAEFLKQFDWEKYKTERLKNVEMSQEKFNNPNNTTVEVKVAS